MPIRHEVQRIGKFVFAVVDVTVTAVVLLVTAGMLLVQREWKYLHVSEQQLWIGGTGIEQAQVLEQLQIHRPQVVLVGCPGLQERLARNGQSQEKQGGQTLHSCRWRLECWLIVTIVRLPRIACRSSGGRRRHIYGAGCVVQLVGMSGSRLMLLLVVHAAIDAITDAQQGLNGGQVVVALPKQAT